MKFKAKMMVAAFASTLFLVAGAAKGCQAPKDDPAPTKSICKQANGTWKQC